MSNQLFPYSQNFAHPVAKHLLESGRLDMRWVSSFLSLPDVSQTAPGKTWSVNYFKLMHFFAMYLPLRYWAWSRLTGEQHVQTEELLASLHVMLEENLWTSAIGAADGVLEEDEAELVNLIFGSTGPLHMTVENL